MGPSFAKKLHECPTCGSHSVRRSERRGIVEKFLYRLLLIWPYRCLECDGRFFDYKSQVSRSSQARGPLT